MPGNIFNEGIRDFDGHRRGAYNAYNRASASLYKQTGSVRYYDVSPVRAGRANDRFVRICRHNIVSVGHAGR